MKKFKTMMAMMLALVSMCVAFSSCSSDDDDTVAAAKEIAGTYTSSLDMTVMGQASTYENLTMKIEAVDDATVKVTLPACGEGMMALPALEVPAVKVSGSNGAYAFSQENYAGTITVNGAEKKCDPEFNYIAFSCSLPALKLKLPPWRHSLLKSL